MALNINKWFWRCRPWISLHGSVRTNSSSVQPPLEKVKMSKHVELWKNKSAGQSLPLVMIFPWLRASTSAIHKYADLYHKRGMDVLVIRGMAKHFLWPPSAFKLFYELDKCLVEIPTYKKFLIHAFSVGAYNYTIARMDSKPGVHHFQPENVIGQVYDSLVFGSPEKMADGLANSITENKLLQYAIKKISYAYIKYTRGTEEIFHKVIKFNEDHFLPVPSLFLYCYNDVLCDVKVLQAFLDLQRSKHGDKIWEKTWPESVHAGHLRFHRDEYLLVWNSFLKKLGL